MATLTLIWSFLCNCQEVLLTIGTGVPFCWFLVLSIIFLVVFCCAVQQLCNNIFCPETQISNEIPSEVRF